MSVPTCAFCGADQQTAQRLIAGPQVYICGDCVGLCAEILVAEQRADQTLKLKLHGSAQRLAELRVQLEESERRRRHMRTFFRLAVQNLNEAVDGEKGARCAWCEHQSLTDEESRQHAATCERHPAVIELRKLQSTGAQP